jgi:hypothetical protein
MVKKKSKSEIVITEKYRKKYGVCEHDQVSYKALDKLNRSLLLHCKRLSRDIDRKGKMMELWMKKQKDRMTPEDQPTEDSSTEYYPSDIETQNIIQEEEIKEKNLKIEELQKLYDEAIEVNTDVVEKNRDCIKKNREILKDHNDIVRAYNGLAEMGKFAEDEGIDIKKHNKMLPEHNKYDFSQSHTLLENGKVKHSWKLKPKKNGKEN